MSWLQRSHGYASGSIDFACRAAFCAFKPCSPHTGSQCRPMRIDARRQYRFGVWARQDKGDGEVGGELEVLVGLQTILFVAPIPQEWTLFTADVDFPAEKQDIDLELHYTNWASTNPDRKVRYGQSRVYLDDVLLVPKE